MADFSGSLATSSVAAMSGTIKGNGSLIPASAIASTGNFSVFVGTLATSISVPSVQQPVTQKTGQLFP